MSDELGTTKNDDEDTEGNRVLRQGDAGGDDTGGNRVLRQGDAGRGDTGGNRVLRQGDAGQDEDTEGNRVLRQGNAGRDDTVGSSLGNVEEDDVAGHLRMTDEQLASGTTPSEARQEQRQKK
jgi:hypothetical protein